MFGAKVAVGRPKLPSRRSHTRVALVRGNDRKTNVSKALHLIADQIDVSAKERILIGNQVQGFRYICLSIVPPYQSDPGVAAS